MEIIRSCKQLARMLLALKPYKDGKYYIVIPVTAPGLREDHSTEFLFGPVWHLEARLSWLVTDQQLSEPYSSVASSWEEQGEAEPAEFKNSFQTFTAREDLRVVCRVLDRQVGT